MDSRKEAELGKPELHWKNNMQYIGRNLTFPQSLGVKAWKTPEAIAFLITWPIKGIPATSCKFFLGIRLLPPRAGITQKYVCKLASPK